MQQQMIQAGGLGPSNQAAAAAALHYGHIPQLTSQMQGLQLAHPHGGYLPPQHQWSALWAHQIPQQPQPPMRLPAPMPQQLPQSQQQQSLQPTPVPQQPTPVPQQSPANDSKHQVPLPL